MPFSKEMKLKIEEYCSCHLPKDSWYETEFDFIKDNELRDRIIREFKAIRFAYKLYEGLSAENEKLVFEVRNQILAYASIYEAVIENVLDTYYFDSAEYQAMLYWNERVEICIPRNKLEKIKSLLEHDGKELIICYYAKKKKDKTKIRFDEKCIVASKLGLIYPFENGHGDSIDLPKELIEIYSFRNGIHLIAEQRKGLDYQIELSKRAYRRIRPFINQVRGKLIEDGRYHQR